MMLHAMQDEVMEDSPTRKGHGLTAPVCEVNVAFKFLARQWSKQCLPCNLFFCEARL